MQKNYSMRWIKTNESKGLFFSFLIHSIILGVVLFSNDKPVKPINEKKMVSIDLLSYQQPKQNTLTQKSKPIKKQKLENKTMKQKVIKKQKPKNKPIIKEETPKNKPIIKKETKSTLKNKAVKKVIKPKLIQPQKIKKQPSFIKTNFAIIRDMVLSNLKYPNIAKRMGWQGVVKVKLIIDRNGKLIHYSIEKSSKRKQLDKAALIAVKAILTKNLPKPQTKTTIILPITFKLK